MAYLEARAGLARAGVTHAGYAAPHFRIYIAGVDRTDQVIKDASFVITDVLGETPSTLRARVRPTRGGTVTMGEGVGSSAKTVYAPTDFTYIGTWAIPYVPAIGSGTFDPLFTRGLTHRYVNGQLRFLVNGQISNSRPTEIAEVRGDVVLKTSPPWNRPNWFGTGAICRGDGNYTTFTPAIWTEAIRWDPVDEQLYWTQYRVYDALYVTPHTTGLITLSTPSGDDMSTQTGGLGPVRMETSVRDYGTRYIKDIVLLPDWFVSQLPQAGCRIGLGCGGNMSTQQVGPCSIGPALVATTPLDPDVDVALQTRDTAPRVRLVMHPFHANGVGVSPLHAVRDTHYASLAPDMWDPPNGSYGSGTGWWASEDFNQGHGVWVETDTKAGWLVFPRFVVGGGLTYVQDNPVSTLTDITLPADYVAHLLVGDKLLVDNGYDRPGGNAEFDDLGLGEIRTISAITGNVVTVTPALHQTAPYGNRFFTGEYYVDGGIGWSRARPAWVCYDPAQLLRAALNEITYDTVPWAWESNPPGGSYPDFASTAPYVFPATEGGHRGTVRGATFDSVTKRLHVLMHGGTVHVYQVAD